ncbi:UNVERIFIED_CONTAM: hypothetical protein K2H54_022296 [Gekko kuhli]
MPPSALEVAMQTMASVLGDYVEEKNGVPVITKNGLDQLVKQQLLNFDTEEIDPTAYEIRIPLVRRRGKGRRRPGSKPRGNPGTREEYSEDLAVSIGQEDSTAQLRGQKLLQVSDPIDDADIVDEVLTVLISIIENNFLRMTVS